MTRHVLGYLCAAGVGAITVAVLLRGGSQSPSTPVPSGQSVDYPVKKVPVGESESDWRESYVAPQFRRIEEQEREEIMRKVQALPREEREAVMQGINGHGPIPGQGSNYGGRIISREGSKAADRRAAKAVQMGVLASLSLPGEEMSPAAAAREAEGRQGDRGRR